MEHLFLLKSVQVIDPDGPWHEQVVDVLLDHGQIAKIGETIRHSEAIELHEPGSYLSRGWIDGQVHFREPGDETKEGIMQGLQAAAQGGFASVAILPSTRPCVDHSSAVRNVLSLANRAHSEGVPTIALPLACVTEQAQGKQLSEMHDLSMAGAVGFTDDAPLDHVGALQRALTYGETHGKVIIDVPYDRELNAGGIMHEGIVSTEMGVLGIPSEAESIRIARNLNVLKYAGGRLHLSVLTTSEGVELVAKPKEGLQITCGTTALHLMYTDSDLKEFNGSLRVISPSVPVKIGTRFVKASWTAPLTLWSDHRPEDLEHHDVEFMLSPEGVASLPSAFALALQGLTEHTNDMGQLQCGYPCFYKRTCEGVVHTPKRSSKEHVSMSRGFIPNTACAESRNKRSQHPSPSIKFEWCCPWRIPRRSSLGKDKLGLSLWAHVWQGHQDQTIHDPESVRVAFQISGHSPPTHLQQTLDMVR